MYFEVDDNFYIINGPFTLIELIQSFNLETDSKFKIDELLIFGVRTLDKAKKNEITFLFNNKYTKLLLTTNATACIIDKNTNPICKDGLILLKTPHPYYTYAQLIKLFYSKKTSINSNSVKIGKNCYIGHNVILEDNVIVGDNCYINSNSIISYGVKIGNNVNIGANVTITYAIIGNNVTIDAGTCIGQSGFGFATYEGTYYDIFHTGRVIIGNDVNIGANTTIDRGSLKDTIIGDMCRIDNLVQIAHNVHLGKGCVIVSQVGIAGSTYIGDYCMIGGQAGIIGHITIENNCEIAARSMVTKSLPAYSKVGGMPAIPLQKWHKQSILLKRMINQKFNDSAN